MPTNPPIVTIPVPEPDEDMADVAALLSQPSATSEHSLFCTEANSFGVYQKYRHGAPTITPDEFFTMSSVLDAGPLAQDLSESQSKASWWSSFGLSSLNSVEHAVGNYFAPFLNASIFLLMSWFYDGSSIKSYAEIDRLVHNVIQHEDFKASDFDNSFSTARKAERMDKNRESKAASKTSDTSLPFSPEDGWIKGSVSIPLPCDGFKFDSEEHAPKFVIDGIWYRRPLEVIKVAFSEHAAEHFHTTPFKEYWKPSESEPEERIYSETFTADVFNEEYDLLQNAQRTGPNSHLEAFVAGIIFYSDSTHLANFGNASLWPLYMYIGNQSKYVRAKPGEFAAHHIAYIPKVRHVFHVCTFSNYLIVKARRRNSRLLQKDIWQGCYI